MFEFASNLLLYVWCIGSHGMIFCLCLDPDTVDHSLRYATVEVFLNKGVRIYGEVGTVLSEQLTIPTSKKLTDEKGW